MSTKLTLIDRIIGRNMTTEQLWSQTEVLMKVAIVNVCIAGVFAMLRVLREAGYF